MTTPTMPDWAKQYDEVRWSPGPLNIPGLPFGECAHECRHDRIQVIARGPDEIRNMLVKCTAAACTGDPAVQCRAWHTSRQTPWSTWLTVWLVAS